MERGQFFQVSIQEPHHWFLEEYRKRHRKRPDHKANKAGPGQQKLSPEDEERGERERSIMCFMQKDKWMEL